MQPLRRTAYPQPQRFSPALLLIIAFYHTSVACQAQPSQPANDAATTTAHQENPDPEVLLRRAIDQCQRYLNDYSCLFTRQERIRGQLTKQQTIKVYYRHNPRTIYMTWIENPGRVRRALYQQGKYINKVGQELLLVEPTGMLARAMVPALYTPVRGKKARSSSRHTVDQFGFLSILHRIVDMNQQAKRNGDLQLTLVGRSQFASRPTYRIVRRLSINGKHHYNDAYLVIELDQQWLVPVSIRSFADAEATQLLGAYTFRNIKVNTALPNSALTFNHSAIVLR